jgi:hypothetical protein
MISDEAVEAAAKALAAQGWGGWEHVPNELRRAFLRDAKITLEAAAPYMLAQVWAEGHHTGWSDRDDDAQSGWTPSGYTSNTPNPYSSQA